MSAVAVDVNIKARWIAPMTGDLGLLANHTLVIRDGRILDVLPTAEAERRYMPRVETVRPAHLLMPGLVNARTSVAPARPDSDFDPDGALLAIADMVIGGTTTFCDVGCFPRDSADVAAAQGLRAVIGLPVAEHPSGWARPGEYLSKALRLRDELKGHPSICARFAPLDAVSLSDQTLRRMGVLADELDAGMLISLHESRREVDESLSRHGRRPIVRLRELGLLSPALTASHLAWLDGGDLDLARSSGIGITLCLASSLVRDQGLSPLAQLEAGRARGGDAAREASSQLRLSLGTDAHVCGPAHDLWTEMRLLALHSGAARMPAALLAATHGGAAALGLEAEIGTLEAGKWADVCCVDLAGPAASPARDPLRELALQGGRDLVTDVWVAGRALLADRRLTRIDWPQLASRLGARQPEKGSPP